MPIWALSDDLKLGVCCVNGNGGDNTLTFNNTGSAVLPIFYSNRDNRDKRHNQWQHIVRRRRNIGKISKTRAIIAGWHVAKGRESVLTIVAGKDFAALPHRGI